MSLKKTFTGWRDFSATEQTALDAPEALTSNHNYRPQGFMTIEVADRQDNSDELNGFNQATDDEIVKLIGKGSHSRKLVPHEAAHLLGFCLGKVTQDQPDVANAPPTYRHWIERDLTRTTVPAFTLIEHNGATQNLYNAVVVKSVKIVGNDEGYCELDAEFMSRGDEVDNSEGKQSAVSGESYLKFGDVEFLRDGSLTGTVAAGTLAHGSGTSLKGDMKSFELSIDNDVRPRYEFGSSGGLVSRFDMGKQFLMELSAQMEFQSDADQAAMSAGTEYVISIPLIGATIEDVQKYTVDLIFPKVIIESVEKSDDDGVLVSAIKYKVMEDATYGSFIVRVINKQQDYVT